MTVANIRKLICLLDLTWEAIEANSGSGYDWKTGKGIPTDFQAGPFFGKKFKNQNELNAAFAGQLERIKANSKIKEINDLKNTDDLVAYYETSGKFGLKAEEKKKLDEDADSKSKKSGIYGNKNKTRHNFSKAEKEDIKSYIKEKGCTVKENGPNLIIAIGKDGKEVCTVTPNEVVVSGTDYKLAILLALINFPGQELVFNHVSDIEKPKFEKAFVEAIKDFKKANHDAKDIKYRFENEVSKKSDKSSKNATEIEKKYPEVPNDEEDGPLTNGHWYSNFEINKIISATEYASGQTKHCPDNFLIDNNNGRTNFGKSVQKYNKICVSVGPKNSDDSFSVEDCKTRVKAAASNFIKQWNEIRSKEERGILVFSIHVGGNHYATYACNTDGEILAVNPMSGTYRKWDNAAVRGIQEALRENKMQAKLPIKITADQNEDFRQKDGSICGAVSAAMSVAISSDHTFAEQTESLKEQMSKLCGKNTNHYPSMRKEHQMLINIYKKAIESGDSEMKEEGQEDIRDYLETCEYHKPNVHNATLSSRMTRAI